MCIRIPDSGESNRGNNKNIIMSGKNNLSAVERIKTSSDGLRGTLKESLAGRTDRCIERG